MKPILIALLLCSPALADEVKLKGGGRLSGAVTDKGDKIVVRTEHGTMTFPRDHVEWIDYSKPSLIQEYDAKLAAASTPDDFEALLVWTREKKMPTQTAEVDVRLLLARSHQVDWKDGASVEAFAGWAEARGQTDAARGARESAFAIRVAKDPAKALEWAEAHGVRLDVRRPVAERLLAEKRATLENTAAAHSALGEWARARGLAADATILFWEAIKIDPEFEAARRALGYELYMGKWMMPDEVRRSQGLVDFEGRWVTPREREILLEAQMLEKARRDIALERALLAKEREAARAEFARQAAELDARAADIARQLDALRNAPPPVVVVDCGHGCRGTCRHRR